MIVLWLWGQLIAALVGAQHGTCPRGWWIDGVRPDGRYSCVLTSHVEDDSGPLGRVDGVIYCNDLQTPMITADDAAACKLEAQIDNLRRMNPR